MKNYIYIHENSFSDNIDELYKIINKNDISIVFSSSLEETRKNDLIELAESLKNNKVLLYESSLGKGGGGSEIPLDLISLGTYSICLIFTTTIFTELSKDIYKNSLGKLFKPNPINKLNIGNVVLEIILEDIKLQYVFFDYFRPEDSLDAFSKIKEHLSSLDKAKITDDLVRFVYDRKDELWKIM